MTYTYNITTIDLKPGTGAQAMTRIKDHLADIPGELVGYFLSDIGALNRILLIHRAISYEQAISDRNTLSLSIDPFGCKEFTTAFATNTFQSLPFLGPIKTGNVGPVFEVRTYKIKPGGMDPTIELWRKAIPDRIKISPLLAGLYNIDEAEPCFIQIWPYQSLDERAHLRAKAVADGVWPPPNAGLYLTEQQADIYYAGELSPLQ
ncbi:MAG TPA: NIPSNAP family protein [Candidatus Udaeobacter sp.]|nr:NIPSNAP family protein [Candidatus Udaeobacter sp.]